MAGVSKKRANSGSNQFLFASGTRLFGIEKIKKTAIQIASLKFVKSVF